MPPGSLTVQGAGISAINGRYHSVPVGTGIAKVKYRHESNEHCMLVLLRHKWRLSDSIMVWKYEANVLEDSPDAIPERWTFCNSEYEPAPTVTVPVSSTLMPWRESENIRKIAKRKRSLDNVRTLTERLWKQRKFTDAVVSCEGETFPVHRSILCAASSTLDAAFSSELEEGKTCVYDIKDSPKGAVEAMLQFIYTGVYECPANELPFLLELAVMYDLQMLCIEVAGELVQDVTTLNVRARADVLERHSANLDVKKALDAITEIVARDAALIQSLF